MDSVIVQSIVGGALTLVMWFYGKQVVQAVKDLASEVRQFRIDYEHRMTAVEKDIEALKHEKRT